MKEAMKPAVSSLGRYRDYRGITKTPRPSKNGYVSVNVKNKCYSLHRLIAFAFFGAPPSPKYTVDHKDMNRGNNRRENLEYVTPREQMQRSYAKNKDRRSGAFKRSKPVKGRKVGSEEWSGYESARDAARILGLNNGHVSACALGKTKTTGGYEFTWDEPNEPDSLLGEEWKRVPDLNCSVSSFGRFRDSRGITKSPHPKKSGYVEVKVNYKDYFLHRLIAFAFLGAPPSPEYTVDHKDMNRGNNHVDNLEWVTKQQQVQRSYANNKDRISNAFKRSKPVKGRKVGSEEWSGYESARDAARILGLNNGHVSDAANGKRKQTGGYEFMWDEPNEPACLPGEEWKDIVIYN